MALNRSASATELLLVLFSTISTASCYSDLTAKLCGMGSNVEEQELSRYQNALMWSVVGSTVQHCCHNSQTSIVTDILLASHSADPLGAGTQTLQNLIVECTGVLNSVHKVMHDASRPNATLQKA